MLGGPESAVTEATRERVFEDPSALDGVNMSFKKSPFPDKSQIPAQLALNAGLHQREYLVNGELLSWRGPVETVYSPILANENGDSVRVVVGSYPLATKNEALAALDAAHKAYAGGLGLWPRMTSEDRIACVEKFLDSMQAKRDEVVKLLVWEIAKSVPDAEKEFDRTVEYVRESIKVLRQRNEASHATRHEAGIAGQTDRAPIGVVLCMGPFNYPLNETFTTLIPALLMGNTVVFKPPKIGVVLHQPLLEAFRASFPAGVVNTVYGDGKEVVTPIMESGKIDVLAFIGSSRVADILVKQHPHPHRLTMVLGLGAKNPGIVLADADISSTVKECVTGALSYNGQRCTALKTIFVHRSRADEFVEQFSSQVAALKKGMPWEPGVQITPVAEPGKSAYLKELVEDAVAHGAKVVNQGGGDFTETLYTPAVLYPVSPSARIFSEEQFGPIVPIVPFDDVNEVIENLRDSPYGQQASVFGKNVSELHSVGSAINNLGARVNFNAQCQRGPDSFSFGGRKSSALGSLSYEDALNAFSLPAVWAGKDTELTNRILSAR